MKITLTQFLDNFETKIFYKHTGQMQMKINIFMEAMKLVTILCGWWLSSVGGDYSFWVLNFLLVVLPLPGVGLVYPQKGVTELKNLNKKDGFFLLHLSVF